MVQTVENISSCLTDASRLYATFFCPIYMQVNTIFIVVFVVFLSSENGKLERMISP